MPDIHHFPPPPLPRSTQAKSSTNTATPARQIVTYSTQRRSPVMTKQVNGSAPYSKSSASATPGSSSSRIAARRASPSSSLSPAPGSFSPVKRRAESDDEAQGEKSMDFDVEEEAEDEELTDTSSHSGRSEAEDEPEPEEDEPVDSEWSDDDDDDEVIPILHVEVRRTPRHMNSHPHSEHTLSKMLESYIKHMEGVQAIEMDMDIQEWGNIPVLKNVDKVFFAETEPASETFDPSRVDIRFHFYEPSTRTDLEQFTAVTEDDDEADAVPAASVRELPSMELEGIWENLIYSTDLKPRLLRYINSTMAFSDARVDFNKVSWNRLVLLHGPPGTGKTSLCRALAQKLLVRMSSTYITGKLVEINSHSLFSKWFSESGKLVQKLFSRVTEMVEDQRCLVVVMIDEVESLTAARSAAVSGSEPGDALRVVNALLTQLDKLKTRQNVLVLTTSNIPDTIDSAFIDRADEKFFVDYPPPEAVFWILKGCLAELGERGMMRPCDISTVKEVKDLRRAYIKERSLGQDASVVRLRGKAREDAAGLKLLDIARKCFDANLAGRFLRRLPLLAHSHYLSVTTKLDDDGQPKPRSIEKWLEAFALVVYDEIQDRARIAKKTNTTLSNGHAEVRD